MNLLYDPATLQAPEPNPLARKLGALSGKTCKTCQHLYRKHFNNKYYYKCLKRGDTNGVGTDHRCKWHACKLYVRQAAKYFVNPEGQKDA